MFVTLALSLAGAGVGFALAGTPLGLALGLLVGRAVGAALFGGAVREGPRLEDRSVHSNDLGAPLAVLFGTEVIGGHTLWVKNNELQSRIVERTEGGFFGLFGGTTIKEERLFLTAAFALCDCRRTGAIKGVARIWEDTRLIYELDQAKLDAALASGDPLPAQQVSQGGLEFEVKLGTADQHVDPEIDADMQRRGDGPAPAWRHVAHVKIKNRDVTEFRRMPDYRFEVVGAGTDTFTWQPWPVPAVFEQNNFGNYSEHAPHPEGHDVWVWADNLGSRLAIMDLRRHAVRVQRDYAAEGDTFDPGTGEIDVRLANNPVLAMDDLGRIYAARGGTGIWRMNAETLIAEAYGADLDASRSGTDRSWMRVKTFEFPPPTGTFRILVVNAGDVVAIANADTMEKLVEFTLAGAGGNSLGQMVVYDIAPVDPLAPGAFDLWFLGRDPFNGAGSMAHWRATLNPAGGALSGSAAQQTVFSEGLGSGDHSLVYVPAEDVVYAGTPGGSAKVYRRDLSTVLASTGDGGWLGQGAHVVPRGSELWVTRDQTAVEIARITVPSLRVLEEYNLGQWTQTAGWHSVPGTAVPRSLVDPLFHSVTVHVDNGVARYFLPRLAPQTVARAWVYRTLAEMAGVPAARIDVSAVTGRIWGYAIRRDATAADAMRKLLAFYGEDVAMADRALKVFPLQTTPALTVAEADLGAGLGRPAGDRAEEERAPAAEVPRQLEVVYPDRTTPGYEPNLARSPMVPALVPGAKATQREQLPFPLAPEEAARGLDAMHRRMWIERDPVTIALTRRYPQLHAGDVVRVPRDVHAAGRSIDLRITEVVEGEHPVLKGVRAASAYGSAAVGVSGTIPTQELDDPAPSELLLLDMPMLPARDRLDDDAGLNFAVRAKFPGVWPGTEVLRSTDQGQTFAAWSFASVEAVIGIAESALADGPSHVPDETNTLTVQWFRDPGLASVTEATLYSKDAGGSLFALWNASAQDWELLKARDVADRGANRTTLSYLIRGRQGTEHRTSGHVAGDPVVKLDTALLVRETTGAELDQQRTFAAVTLGLTLLEADVEDFTNAGRALRPWAMVVRGAARDGSNSLTVDVSYRTRYGKGLDDGSITALADGKDAGVDVLDAPGGSVLNTYTFTGDQFSYTATQQSNDGLTPGDPVTLVFHHLADTAYNAAGSGRGVANEVTV